MKIINNNEILPSILKYILTYIYIWSRYRVLQSRYLVSTRTFKALEVYLLSNVIRNRVQIVTTDTTNADTKRCLSVRADS